MLLTFRENDHATHLGVKMGLNGEGGGQELNKKELRKSETRGTKNTLLREIQYMGASTCTLKGVARAADGTGERRKRILAGTSSLPQYVFFIQEKFSSRVAGFIRA